MLHTTYKLVI